MRAQVDEEDRVKLRDAQRVNVTLYSFPGRPFVGAVAKVYPQADAERRTFEVDVKFDAPDPGLAPGMTGELAFEVAHKERAMVIPAQALQVGGARADISQQRKTLQDGIDDYPRELEYATELIELIKEVGDFSIGVAAHPELHPRSEGDRDLDRRYLAAKLAAADFGITQFFFKAEPYLQMVD